MPSGLLESPPLRQIDRLGRRCVSALSEIGMSASLVGESIYWLVTGRMRGQPVRPSAVFLQMMQIGVGALPIATVLAATIGMMLAIQSLYSLGRSAPSPSPPSASPFRWCASSRR
jgi:ABC-type transporter Mla maintaining outer membrane lipid asymmetry permease subunit MlaE